MGRSLSARVSRTVVSVGVVVVAVLVGGLLALFAAVAGNDLRTTIVALVVLAETGYALVALAFLWVTGRGLAYLDLPRPWARHLWYGLAGAGLLLATQQLLVIALEFAGVVTHTGLTLDRFPVDVVDAAQAVLPALVFVSILVIGPAEELLFRNVIQKYLAEVYSDWGAIGVTSVLFGLLHAPNYLIESSATPVSVGVFLTFTISIVLGWLYVRTGTVLAPIVAHGVYDAVLFATAYLRLSGWPPFA